MTAERKAARLQAAARGWTKDGESLLFLAVIALHLVPLWAFKYFPTQDGPSHLANALALLDFSKEGCTVLPAYYYVNYLSPTNWLGQLSLAGLLALFKPLVAEKVFLSGYVVLLPLSVRYCLKRLTPGAASWAFLVFPFIYSFHLQMGFYSFAYSIAFFFFALACWLKPRPRGWTARDLAWMGALGLALFLWHVYSFVLLAVLILAATLAEICLSRREGVGGAWETLKARVLAPYLAFLPAFALTLLFVFEQKEAVPGWWRMYGSALEALDTLADRTLVLLANRSLVSFTRWELLPAVATSAVVFALALYALSERGGVKGRGGRLLALPLGCLALYLVVPRDLLGGGFIIERTSTFFYLTAIVWLGVHPFPRRALGWAARAAPVAASVALMLIHLPTYSKLDAQIDEYVSAGTTYLRPNSTLLPISYAGRGLDEAGRPLSYRVKPLRHASGYVAARKCMVVLSNNEAAVGYHPLAFRPELNPYTHMEKEIERDAPTVDFLSYSRKTGAEVDYVLIWGLRDDLRGRPEVEAVMGQLREGYDEVPMYPASRLVRIFRRKGME